MVSAAGARAETTCETVRTDLMGRNVFGQHTMMELSEDTRHGSCDAAAYLTRRAKDAQGFLKTNCPADGDLAAVATGMVQLGQDTLASATCKD